MVQNDRLPDHSRAYDFAVNLVRCAGMLVVSCLFGLPAEAQYTQQGPKLSGFDAAGGAVAGGASEGGSVAISGNGNTIIVGGAFDNFDYGASWIYSQSN